MKRIINSFFLLTGIFLLNQSVFSQTALHFFSINTFEVGDTVTFKLADSKGDIQWEYSSDLKKWLELPGAQSGIYHHIVDSAGYIRAKLVYKACTPFYSDTTYISIQKVSEKLTEIDRTDLKLLSDSAQMEEGIYIYKGGDAVNIDTGKIILGTNNDGYIRRVTGMVKADSTVMVHTEQAKLEDVFEYLDITDSLKVTFNNQKKTTSTNAKVLPMDILYMIPGAELKAGGLGGIDLSKVAFSVEVSSEKKDAKGNVVGSVSGTVTIDNVQGSIDFNPTIIRKVKVGLFKLKEFELSLKGEINHSISARVRSTIKATIQKEIPIWTAKPKNFMIGPVPCQMIITLKAVISVSASGTASMTFGYETHVSTLVGAYYHHKHDPKWGTRWDNNIGFNVIQPTFDSEVGAEAKIAIVPQAQIKIAGAGGPYINLSPYIKSNVSVNMLNWQLGVYGGVDANLGFSVEILGKSLASYNVNLPLVEKEFYKKTGAFTAKKPHIENPQLGPVSAYSAQVISYSSAQQGAPVTERGFIYSTLENALPYNPEGKLKVGEGTGNINGVLGGLASKTTYYVMAFATNIAGTSYSDAIQLVTGEFSIADESTITDADGNIYRTVKIGNQWWMAENLKTTTYASGEKIPFLNERSMWYKDTLGGYSWVDHLEIWKDVYGGFYSYPAVVSPKGLCPTGWHVPSHEDWKILEVALGMSQEDADSESSSRGAANAVGDKMKSASEFPTSHPRWNEGGGGNNASTLNMIPGGYMGDGYSHHIGQIAYYWTSTVNSYNNSVPRELRDNYNTVIIGIAKGKTSDGCSVRCVKD